MDKLIRLALQDFRFAAAAREVRNAVISMRDVGLTEAQQNKVYTLAEMYGDCGHLPGTVGDYVQAIIESIGVPPRKNTDD